MHIDQSHTHELLTLICNPHCGQSQLLLLLHSNLAITQPHNPTKFRTLCRLYAIANIIQCKIHMKGPKMSYVIALVTLYGRAFPDYFPTTDVAVTGSLRFKVDKYVEPRFEVTPNPTLLPFQRHRISGPNPGVIYKRQGCERPDTKSERHVLSTSTGVPPQQALPFRTALPLQTSTWPRLLKHLMTLRALVLNLMQAVQRMQRES